MRQIILALITMASTSALAGQDSGGGHELEVEFVELANILLSNGAVLLKQDFSKFKVAVDSTEVSYISDLCTTYQDHNTGEIFKKCLNARYDSAQKLIEFSGAEWLKNTCLQNLKIVTHEYGRAAGIENGNYKYSSQVEHIQGLHDSCEVWEREKASKTLQNSCKIKVQNLVQSMLMTEKKILKRADKDSDRFQYAYDTIISDDYGNWKLTAQNCLAEGQDACIKSCLPIRNGNCFRICNSN